MKHYFITGLMAVMLGMGVLPRALATEYFVEKSGNDANPGSRMQPFESIQKAASLMLPGDICTISRGVYRETVRPAMSGKPDKWIRFQTAPGETVTISGADENFVWQQVTGAIYRASATNVIQVLVDDVVATTGNLDIYAPSTELNLRPTYRVDSTNNAVYLQLPHNDPPEGHRVELQIRSWGVNLQRLVHVEVKGINLSACGINLAGARFCRVEDGHVWWGRDGGPDQYRVGRDECDLGARSGCDRGPRE